MEGKGPRVRLQEVTKRLLQLLRREEQSKAVELLRALKVMERVETLHAAIDVLLHRSHIHRKPQKEESQWLDYARKEVAILPESEERDRLWQRLAIVAAYHGEVSLSREYALYISNKEVQAYAYSGAVQALVRHGERQEAEGLLSLIADEGAREDAMNALRARV